MYRDWNPFDHKLRAFINTQQNRHFLLTLLRTVGGDQPTQPSQSLQLADTQNSQPALSVPD